MVEIEHLTEQDYYRLIDALSGVRRWQWDNSFSSMHLSDLASAAMDDVVEGRFKHSRTSGVLYFLMPDLAEPPGSIRCLLEQPFDSDISLDSTFLNEIGAATGDLVPAQSNPYISVVSDPHTVLKISVPAKYSPTQVSDAAEVAADVSEDVADLYKEIENSVAE
jgi:hypothetical protein